MGLFAALWSTVPWGQLLVQPPQSPPVQRPTPAPAKPRPAPAKSPDQERPGCFIADTCVQVYGYLEELSEGEGGFGVLALGKAKLDQAVREANKIGMHELAEGLQQIASQMPHVHDEEAAGELMQELHPLKQKAWRLGRACGLSHH